MSSEIIVTEEGRVTLVAEPPPVVQVVVEPAPPAPQIVIENNEVSLVLSELPGPRGVAGADGAAGLSAYQIAVNNGFEGTEEEWLDSISGSGMFRGEWTPDTLAYLADFADSSIPAEFTYGSGGSGSVSVINIDAIVFPNQPSYDKQLRLYLGDEGDSAFLQLDLAALGLSNPTRVVWYQYGKSPNTGRAFTNNVTLNGALQYNNGNANFGWDRREVIVGDAPNVLRWQYNSTVYGGIYVSTGIAGIEVYTKNDPFMLNEFVIYQGKLWKSDADNNVGVPGVEGWTEIPLGASEAYADQTEADAVAAAMSYTDSQISEIPTTFRGVWASDEVIWSAYFESEIPSEFQLSYGEFGAALDPVLSTVAEASRPNPPPDTLGALKIRSTNVFRDTWCRAELPIASLGLTGLTRAKMWACHTGSESVQFSGLKTDVTLFSQVGPFGWTQYETPVTADDTFIWTQDGLAGISANEPGSAYLAAVEIYGTLDPFMLGEYVVHEGKLWKSDLDNNAGIPGVSGWTKIPLGLQQADLDATLTAANAYTDTEIDKVIAHGTVLPADPAPYQWTLFIKHV